MSAFRVAALLALVPAAALAQGATLGAARKASAAESAATEQRARQADEASRPEVTPPAPVDAAPAPVDAASQPGVDLTGAAERLESGTVQLAPPAPVQSSAADAYTVKPGDTLWDLSGRFLNNPWYWPKIWSYNPEITNPHWIYPGNTLRFLPTGEDAARVEPALVAGGTDDLEAPRELESLSRADMKKPLDYGEGDEVAVVGPYKIGYVPPKGLYARRDSFVTRRELEESGVISASSDEKTYLSVHDRAYATFAKAAPVRVGDAYVLYRTDRAITHPVTREVFGWKSTIIGTAKVVATDDRVATLEIAGVFDTIERGTYLGPWKQKLVKQVQRRPNAKDLDGYIIASQQDLVTEIGEHHLVFVDKGRDDGVEEGNVFTVTRNGDPTNRAAALAPIGPLPDEDVGSLIVVDAQANASAALVVRSLHELAIGDHVVMRTGPGLARGNARAN